MKCVYGLQVRGPGGCGGQLQQGSQGPGVIGLSPEPQDEASSLADCGQESSEHQALYRDIWSLRASLEQYGSSDQISNNDQESTRSDADSVCSLGGRTERGEMPSYPSLDIGEGDRDEAEEHMELPLDQCLGAKCKEKGDRQASVESERGSDGESGNRKLLQMDSGYMSIEAPPRTAEELRLFGSSGSLDKTAVEKRHFFTSAGRTGTVGESLEAHVFQEEPDDEIAAGAIGGVVQEPDKSPLGWSPYGQMFTPREVQPHPPLSLHRRDYSIDEKTDALFHEFLRHDPQFDLQESPRKHRSRVHLRKQWQRHKQYSDPGVRYQYHSFERQRTPLRRGDSVNYPLDTGFHSTLPRIVSAPDEEASEGAPSAPQTPKAEVEEEDRRRESPGSSRGSSTMTIKDEEACTSCSPPPIHDREGLLGENALTQEDTTQAGFLTEPPDMGHGPQTITAELTDKLSATLDERLYTGLRRTRDISVLAECVVAVSHTSPDHSPV
ncbi:hypothetical protein UPYG_G00035640 [Umbra pygmaea]|uniref:Uncharacterized protein n=1 Tax=Umbra pygmaea TaxID=75934 RepID=A0ABD0XNV4_UMBPY